MATVTLSSVTIVDDANVPLRQSVRTSADGTYVFAGLPLEPIPFVPSGMVLRVGTLVVHQQARTRKNCGQ